MRMHSLEMLHSFIMKSNVLEAEKINYCNCSRNYNYKNNYNNNVRIIMTIIMRIIIRIIIIIM